MNSMEKAVAYDKALERAKGLYDFYKDNPAQAQKFLDIFPELAESEDEKIRKEIIEYIKTGTYHKSWIDWLEKQGKQKSAWSEEDETELTNTIIMLKEGASLRFHKNNITEAVDWLRSLRPKKQWKPSEEQIEALEIVCEWFDIASPSKKDIIKSLVDDLKLLI